MVHCCVSYRLQQLEYILAILPSIRSPRCFPPSLAKDELYGSTITTCISIENLDHERQYVCIHRASSRFTNTVKDTHTRKKLLPPRSMCPENFLLPPIYLQVVDRCAKDGSVPIVHCVLGSKTGIYEPFPSTNFGQVRAKKAVICWNAFEDDFTYAVPSSIYVCT
jgi:hypothetical protein